MKAQTSSRILHESRKFCQRGSVFDNVFFLVDEGRASKYHHKRTNIGPPANAIKMEFHCRTVDGPTLNAGLVTLWFFRGSGPVLLGNPIVLWFFRGVRTPVPPLDPPMRICTVSPEPLLLVYWRVRKLSTPSSKYVDCILASYIAYRSSNKTQFCSMIMHVHH